MAFFKKLLKCYFLLNEEKHTFEFILAVQLGHIMCTQAHNSTSRNKIFTDLTFISITKLAIDNTNHHFALIMNKSMN